MSDTQANPPAQESQQPLNQNPAQPDPQIPGEGDQEEGGGGGTNIKVVVRFRPLNQYERVSFIQELDESGKQVCRFISDNQVAIERDKDLDTYSFDRVFSPATSQAEVFDAVGRPVVADVIQGYNGTVFAYGQTGAGKTFTMFGRDLNDEVERGLIPRAASQIFDAIRDSDPSIEFTLACSMLEIYREQLRDLLNPDKEELKIKSDNKLGIYVQGLTEVSVINEEELLEVINLGEEMRTVAATAMNAVSSRSHQLFMLEVRQRLPNGMSKNGRLNLVDLAGSEKIRKSAVSGEGLEEAKKINLSLSALGNVIVALIKKAEHIPYRDSKLTRLLQESLGGNYKTTLIVACSPSPRNIEESLNTLKFAQRARSIKNQVKLNIKKSAGAYMKIIEQLKKELKDLRLENQALKMEQGLSYTPGSKLSTTTDFMPEPIPIQITRPSDPEPPPPPRRPILTKLSVNSMDFPAELTIPEYSGLEDMSPLSPFKRPTLGIYEVDSLNASINIMNRPSALDEQKDQEIETLKKQVQRYKETIQEERKKNQKYAVKLRQAQDQIKKQLQKEKEIEKRAYDLEESYQKALQLINKDQSENEFLKKENQNLRRQGNKLTRSLRAMEEKFKKLNKEYLDKQATTLVEFQQLNESFVNTIGGADLLTLDDMGQSEQSSIIFADEKPIYLPIDTETLSQFHPYSAKVEGLIEADSGVSKDITIFHLRNQVLQAGYFNCNLSAALNSLEWRNKLMKYKYEVKRDLCQTYLQRIHSLEHLLEDTQNAYMAILNVYEQVEASINEVNSKMTVFTPRASNIKRRKARQTTVKALHKKHTFASRLNESRTGNSSYLSNNGRMPEGSFANVVQSIASAIDTEQSDFIPQPQTRKLYQLETDLNIEKEYSAQLKQSLDDSKQEISKYQNLIISLEKQVMETYEDNRKLWSKFLHEFRINCEFELNRKNGDIATLHTVLAEWIHKYMEITEHMGIPYKIAENKFLDMPMKYLSDLNLLIKSTKEKIIGGDTYERINDFMKNQPENHPIRLLSNS